MVVHHCHWILHPAVISYLSSIKCLPREFCLRDACSSLGKGHLIMLSLQLNSCFSLTGKKGNSISKAIQYCGGDSFPKALLDVRSYRPGQLSADHWQPAWSSSHVVLLKRLSFINHARTTPPWPYEVFHPAGQDPRGGLQPQTEQQAGGIRCVIFLFSITFFSLQYSPIKLLSAFLTTIDLG